MTLNNYSESEEELQRILDSLTIRLVRIKSTMNLQDFSLELSSAFYDYVKENLKSVLKQEEMIALYDRVRVADYYSFYLHAVFQIISGMHKGQGVS